MMITFVGRLIYFHRCCWMVMGVNVVGIVVVVDIISRDV